MSRLVIGMGLNDSLYPVTKYAVKNGKSTQVWMCPKYRIWKNMLYRCYDEKIHIKRPTYIDCYVTDDWLTFSNFLGWLDSRYFEGLELDKDLLVRGNKVYGPDTCLMIPRLVNLLLLESNNSRGAYALGVSVTTRSKNKGNLLLLKYVAHSEVKLLGTFDNELDAHRAWQKAKINCIQRAIDTCSIMKSLDSLVVSSLELRLSKLQEDFDNHKFTICL